MEKEQALGAIGMLRKQLEGLAAMNEGLGEAIEIPTRSGNRHALIFKPKEAEGPLPVYIDFFPGGFVSGSPEIDSRFNQAVCDELGVVVIAPGYRLAPEDMYPADKEDALDAVRHIAEHPDVYGIDPARIAVGGHSAGGNIAASVALQLKEDPAINLKCALLDYPPLDLNTEAHEKPLPEGCIDPDVAAAFDMLYRDPKFGKDIYLSPLFATEDDLKGLPPHVIVTAEGDSLRGEGEEYAKHLMAAGVEVTGRRFLGVPHGFTVGMAGFEGPALEAMQEAQRFMIRGLKTYLVEG